MSRQKIAVIGSGLIGRAWAMVFARAGHPVALYDSDTKALAQNLSVIDVSLEDLAVHKLIDEAPATVRARISVAHDLAAALGAAGYVQECILEKLEAKTAIFAAMDAIAASDCILASSTSTFPASAFTEKLSGRSRCLVAHPVNPPHLVPLVELAPAPWTDAAVVARARALHEAAGQVPIIVRREIQGFILNRLQAALLNEALTLFRDGYASAEDIDKTVRDGLGLRWSFIGPFETIDLNAPGGVSDYARRYGGLMHAMAQTQKPCEWNATIVQRLEAERRTLQPAHKLAERQAWRDRRLMGLAAHKRQAAKNER